MNNEVSLKKKEWNESYKKKNNFVFYPHEEVIRFVSKYLKKRIGLNEYIIIKDAVKGLDLGCGIGRHIIYLEEMGFETYGIDISNEAIEYAKKWSITKNMHQLCNRIIVGSAAKMPYNNEFFDFAVSHGVLDSMYFSMAQTVVKETWRVLKSGGLFYFDVISGDDKNHPREYSGEEIVKTKHEEGTVQTYYNWTKINILLCDYFETIDAVLVQRQSVIKNNENSRYHLIVKKKN